MPNMQLILLEDVPSLGKSGDVVRVKPGYGRNYLLPRKLAALASAANVRAMEHQKAVIVARQAKLKSVAEAQAQKLSGVNVKLARKVGDQGKLYGSVTALDVAEGLAGLGHAIDRRHIHLAQPIKGLGDFDVEVRFHREVTATFKVSVVAASA